MSSHHIVRDDQEPALLIAGPVHSTDYLYQLLEWSPSVIVCQEFVEEIVSLGVKIDVVLSEVGLQECFRMRLEYQSPIKFVVYDPLQEPVSAGISYLERLKYPAVNILAEARDQLFDLISKFSKINITICDNGVRWFYCSTGSFKKWMPKGGRLLLKKGDNFKLPGKLSVVGVEHDGLHMVKLSEEGMVVLKQDQDQPFWLGEYIN